jgi:hypothetical protein
MINCWLLFEGGNDAVRIPIEEEDVDAGGKNILNFVRFIM